MPEHMAEMEAVRPAETNEAWRKTEVARNPQRLHPMDYLEAIFTDHQELHGDRGFADDCAMYCAMARLDGAPVMVICNRKGRTTKDRMKFRFGSPEPEGYRKALRAMKLAE
jgi:acetyl-CoA carboxylase carboxyl transferase subunit alpha